MAVENLSRRRRRRGGGGRRRVVVGRAVGVTRIFVCWEEHATRVRQCIAHPLSITFWVWDLYPPGVVYRVCVWGGVVYIHRIHADVFGGCSGIYEYSPPPSGIL